MKVTLPFTYVKCALAFAVLPVTLWANSSGPPPRVSNAPGDRNCAQAGCHTGTAVNGGGGSVSIAVEGGNTYVPGARKTITITITDSNARVYGFQAAARLASNETNGQAGSFVPRANQFVQCEDGRDRPASGSCPANTAIEAIQHSSPLNSGTITFDWNAPATNVGDVRIYVAGNAANGNSNSNGDRIYTANVTLTPQQASGQRPTISQGGVLDNFTAVSGVASGSWIAIFGRDFSSTTSTWDNDPAFREGTPEYQANRLPQSVEGVRVTVNGQPASVYFVSPQQINILAPTDDATGDIQVRVSTPAGESDPIIVRKAQFLPSFVALPQGDRLFIVGVAPNREIVARAGISGIARGFRPGEVLSLFGSGFGPTNPAVNANTSRFAPVPITGTATIRFGETNVAIQGGGFLISPGLYQFNIVVPDLPNGDYPVSVSIGGAQGSSRLSVNIQR
jgi:uncharacterized protein (TIGR03437 family)